MKEGDMRSEAVKNFNTDKEMAGIDWLKGFFRRRQGLFIRKPEAKSAAREMGFHKVAVGKFYQLLGDVYDKYILSADKIYNCDESRISVVFKTKSKILPVKGRIQMGSISYAEPGQTITVEISFILMVFPK